MRYSQIITRLTTFTQMRHHRKRALRPFRISSLFSGGKKEGVKDSCAESDVQKRYRKNRSKMRFWVCSLLLAFSWLVAKGSTTTNYDSSTDSLRHLLTNHFSSDRHHVTSPGGKEDAVTFITETFRKYDLQVFSQMFDTDSKDVQGRNIIGTWPGLNTGTPDDRPVMIAAHYDTARGSPGVCADGSGMTALMEAVRVITARSCMQENSVVFAAFDFEVKESATLDHAACHNAGCGSAKYLKELLIPYIKSLGISSNDFQGAFVLDSVMNFNSTEDSQRLPEEERFKEAPGLQEAYTRIQADGSRGDFIALVGRNFDSPLYQKFISAWEALPDNRFKNQLLHMPEKDLPAELDPYWDVYNKLTHGDHYSFWVADSDLRAIHITDSAQERGYMQECFHKPCDDTDHVTADNLAFLKKVTDATIATVMQMATYPDTCLDPFNDSPDLLKSGIALTGKSWRLKGKEEETFSLSIDIDTVKPNGAVEAVMVNSELQVPLDVVGRYNADNKRLVLRLAEPSHVTKGAKPIDPTLLQRWTVNGEVTGFPGGLVYFGSLSGMQDSTDDVMEEFNIAYSEDPTVGLRQSNTALAVLFALTLVLLIATVAYLCYVKRTYQPFTQMTEKTSINVPVLKLVYRRYLNMALHDWLAVGFLLMVMGGTVSSDRSSTENLRKILVDHFSSNRFHHKVYVRGTAVGESSTTENLRKILVDHFSSNRNHRTSGIGKQSALQFTYDTFVQHNLQVFTQEFETDNPQVKGRNLIGVWPGSRTATNLDRPILIAAHYDTYTDTPGVKGRNLIGVWPGSRTATNLDRPILIAAHYDTYPDTPGVCADGSGMAALLEAIRVITARPCIQYNSIIFAAFDFEEKDTTDRSGMAALLEAIRVITARPCIQYNSIIFSAFDFEEKDTTTPGSACQTFGCGSRAYVSDVLVKYLKFVGISSAQFQGAFILDSVLNFNDSADSQKLPPGDFRNVMRIPIKQMPPIPESPHFEYWPVYRDLTNGDHYSFWAYDADLRAIHITDTGPLRGYMQECYHQACDNTDHLSQNNMAFLKKVTDATIDAVMTLAVFPETCTDPWTKSPEMLKSGINLKGKVWHSKKSRSPFTIILKEFKPNGAVVATLKNGSLTLDLDGRYNADNKLLILRMAQPSNAAALPHKYDPVYLMKWTMTGEVVGFAGGILYYGFLAGPNNEIEEFSVTYSEGR
ncbi:PREDICTED: uncharacterized protein LOC109486460 [Branchiostoma belcheri]|uniref:Uncharacterized protein LOC109486460 n=1 Tax=Branchiostoma belcheri TaxID=7741 RepID=A0A6P5A8B7_BRABE|nr:PREDICTED: uncharacterized protein LOC109486460 [Branchiostoma belcheri]